METQKSNHKVIPPNVRSYDNCILTLSQGLSEEKKPEYNDPKQNNDLDILAGPSDARVQEKQIELQDIGGGEPISLSFSYY